MTNCPRCGETTYFPIHDTENGLMCHACCMATDTLAPGYAWSKNLLSGQRIMIRAENKGVPHMDPAFERYHCM